jgi:asparagine synthase (glutamine-hydrolysing)
MCGIAGIVSLRDAPTTPGVRDAVQAMIDVQAHRGPDGEGIWQADVGPAVVALGHRRLSIIDLSSGGNQPRSSADDRYVITYNGELYNYLELRAELRQLGCEFVSQSDTEVVVHAIATWGEAAFERFNGMWALACVDTVRKVLLLSRDRFGEKPLYVYRRDDALYFSSEIKGILVGSGDRFRVHLPAVWRFLAQSLLQAQHETFFEGITEVPAGHVVEIAFGRGDLRMGAPRSYWAPSGTPPRGTEAELAHIVRETFVDAVRLRLRSDVPVGVLLSGGIDSSAITAAMHALEPGKLQIISATSADPRVNEEPYVDIVTERLGCEVHKVRLDPDPARAFGDIEHAVWHNDEPIGGLSSVAHLLLMRKAKELGVTVVLSGQGADESLCGYLKYAAFHLQQLHRERRYAALARECGWHLLPPWSYLTDFRWADAKRYLPARLQPAEIGIVGPAFHDGRWDLPIGLGEDGVRGRQLLDLMRYSVPALTHYEDRMSMAVSREIRLPYLDHRFVDLFVALPVEAKLRRGWSKWLFRKAMEPLLPPAITWRRDKKGFTTPIDTWLRREWRERVRSLFAGDMVSASLGLVDADRVRQRYAAYCEGTGRSWVFKDVFNPLAIELWARRFQTSLN